MRLSEILSVIEGSDRIRIIEGKRGNREPQYDPGVKILYSGYASMVAYHSDTDAYLERDPEVRRVVASQEIRHKEFKERGLLPPYEPEITRMYEFKDLTIFLYYDIYIFEKEEKET